jgi:hypothetical protein
MKDFYSTIYKAFIYASIVAFIIGFFTDSKLSLGAYISGYSALILAILMILIILFSNILRVEQNSSMFQTLYSIFMTSGPFILLLAVISFVLYLLIFYQNNIVKGHVAPGYSSFSSIIVMLVLIQVYMVYTNINTDKFEVTGKIPRLASSIIYLIGILSAISSIVLYTILKYYSTDGFSTIN